MLLLGHKDLSLREIKMAKLWYAGTDGLKEEIFKLNNLFSELVQPFMWTKVKCLTVTQFSKISTEITHYGTLKAQMVIDIGVMVSLAI